MTLSLRLEPAGIIDMVPSLPIHTSVLIPLLAGLFLAALILRAQRLPGQPLPENGLTTRRARVARRRVRRSRRLDRARTLTRGPHMSTTVRTGMKQNNEQERLSRVKCAACGAPSEAIESCPRCGRPNEGSGRDDAASASFQVYWGRSALALLGLLGLIGSLTTAVALPFVASLTWVVPVLCAAVLVASMAALQVMAVVRRRRIRRRRVEHAMREAMNAHSEDVPDLVQQSRRRSAAAAAARGAAAGIADSDSHQRPFDAMSSDAAGKGGPDSLLSLDEDGLPTSAERLFSAQGRPAESSFFDQSETRQPNDLISEEPWHPREVPSAKYMLADKAQRPDPEPLGTQKPAPAGEVKLKQQAGTPQSPDQVAEGAVPQEPMNLDNVLRRRRA